MKRTVHLLLFAIVVRAMNAQEPSRNIPFDTLHLPFRHLGIEDGLSQGMVLSIVQDRAGFMWFATKDGLNRYDGYSFRVFRNDPKDSTSIRDNHVLAVHEDRAGLLWVGTNSGLDVFDPATEIFHHFPCGDRSSAFRLSGVTQCATSIIVEDPAGHLWVWAGRGLYRITPDRANAITGPGTRIELLGDGKEMIVISMTVDAGGLLRGSSRPDHGGAGHSLIIDTRDEERIAAMIADPPLLTWSPIVSGQGEEEWAAFASDTVRHLTYTFDRTSLEVHSDAVPGGRAPAPKRSGDGAQARDAVRTIPLAGAGWEGAAEATTDAHGALWGISPRLWRIDPRTGRVSRLLPASADLALEASSVECLYRDRSGVMWMGTNGYGMLLYDPRGERFHTRPTRSARAMTALHDGRVLVMAYVYQYYVVREQGITLALSDRKALDMGAFEPCVVEEGRGVLWSNPDFALARYDERDGSTQRFADPDLPVRFPLHMQGDTLISFGSTSAFGRFNVRTKRFSSIPYPVAAEGGGYEFVQSICSDAQGIFWLGTMKGLLRLDTRTEAWTRYTNEPDDPHSLSTDKIFCLLNAPEDANILWVGTNGGGLNRLDKRTTDKSGQAGQFTRFSTANGLPNDVIYGLLADDDGLLWMSTNKGIARFDPVTHEVRSFDANDGLQGDEFNRYAFCKTANGELYFGGVNGFNHFHPQELRTDTLPVQVCITDIRSMNRSIAFGEEGSPLARSTHLARELVIPYSEARMLTIDFASMDYGALGNRQYQYQLENFDPERINAGLTRWATFTNLDPGEYTFKVWGRNRDGVWNKVPTTLRLNILPPWYLTTWAKVLAGLLVLGSIVTYNRLRTRSLRLQRDKLERKVQVRTSELNVALQRSDELLYNILPEEVAAELKEKGEAEAKHIDQVTVLFTDFKGFTSMSEKVSPKELVHDLNECFSAFDRITEKYGIEKIKTIGDAYMAAGGLPTPNTTHALDVIKAAFEIRDFIAEGKAQKIAKGLPYFEIRIGVHTGPVVAGIVGVKKFSYDIWGDTVNTASRMESSGEVGQVNISEATYALVKSEPGLTFTPRGKVQAKGKGALEMYFVEGKPAVAKGYGG